MMRYWVSFARDGDPNDDGLPRWPRYDAASDRCLWLDARIRQASAPYARACDLADRLRAQRF
jgi:para-nitrobenzyl esterase